jgi:hypothetical protein
LKKSATRFLTWLWLATVNAKLSHRTGNNRHVYYNDSVTVRKKTILYPIAKLTLPVLLVASAAAAAYEPEVSAAISMACYRVPGQAAQSARF